MHKTIEELKDKKWEYVVDYETPYVKRLKVPGGWLYYVKNSDENVVFVPDHE